MYPRANQFPQSIFLTIKKPRNAGVGKATNNPSFLQALLVKIVIEILFGNVPLANHGTTVLAADHRPAQ